MSLLLKLFNLITLLSACWFLVHVSPFHFYCILCNKKKINIKHWLKCMQLLSHTYTYTPLHSSGYSWPETHHKTYSWPHMKELIESTLHWLVCNDCTSPRLQWLQYYYFGSAQKLRRPDRVSWLEEYPHFSWPLGTLCWSQGWREFTVSRQLDTLSGPKRWSLEWST